MDVAAGEQFGQPIAKFESVADRIADMKVAIEAGRYLLYQVGWLHGQGKNAVLEAAMAKLFVSEMHSKAALDALQLLRAEQVGAQKYLVLDQVVAVGAGTQGEQPAAQRPRQEAAHRTPIDVVADLKVDQVRQVRCVDDDVRLLVQIDVGNVALVELIKHAG